MIKLNFFVFAIVVIFAICALFAVGASAGAVEKSCEIDPFLVGAPLIIRPKSIALIYPKRGERVLKFKTGETVEFICPERDVLLGGTSAAAAAVEAICISNDRFKVNGQQFLWREVTCNSGSIASSRFTYSSCGISGHVFEIGYHLDHNRFLRTIEICFNKFYETPVYSHYELQASILSSDWSTPGPQFFEDPGFYHIGNRRVNQLYEIENQRITINGLLGLEADDIKYIKDRRCDFLSERHLTDGSDFIYGALQNSTFKYINVVPKWQTCTGDNWKKAEADTRSYADSRNVNLQVWTGTYGVATLPHENTKEDVSLYLYADKNGGRLAVPALLWKIVYQPISHKGIVLISLNNPYENDVARHVLCPDISSSVNWLTWNQHDIEQGYSYSCTVDSFRHVYNIPNIKVSGLLV